MKVVLSHGYFLREDKAEQKIMMPYPPQGILHIGNYLKENNVDCQIYDSTFNSFSDLCKMLEDVQPDALGLYVNLLTRKNILRLIRFVKDSKALRKTRIILGGPDVQFHADKFIQHGADYCLSGEGELSFLKLIRILEEEDLSEISSIKGLTYKNAGDEIKNTGQAELTKDIDALPFPDFEMINIQEYFKIWKSAHGFTSLSVSTSRGCPYKCRWCSKAVFGRSFRRKSAQVVVNELARLQSTYQPDRYWIVDDVFTINKKWLTEFRDAVVSRQLKINYECITRADCMDRETISLLKESGCFRVWIGAESGSQKILDLMDRGVNAAQVREMIRMTKASGMECGTFLMLGYPGETEKDILETTNHLKISRPDHYTLTLSYPIVGTDFYEDVKASGITVPGDWGTYSDREIEFERTYRKAYYTHAIRYIANSVQRLKSRENGNTLLSLKHLLVAWASRFLMFVNK